MSHKGSAICPCPNCAGGPSSAGGGSLLPKLAILAAIPIGAAVLRFMAVHHVAIEAIVAGSAVLGTIAVGAIIYATRPRVAPPPRRQVARPQPQWTAQVVPGVQAQPRRDPLSTASPQPGRLAAPQRRALAPAPAVGAPGPYVITSVQPRQEISQGRSRG